MQSSKETETPSMSPFALRNASLLLFGTIVLLSLSFLCPATVQSQEPAEGQQSAPKRLKRGDSYFGVHFDFHAELTDKNIGQHTTPEMVNTIIDIIHPDYIEVDTKGHPGVSSYPTKVGNHGGSFVGDPLKVWREVTAKRCVALYGHHSGIWDNTAIGKNPQWAAVDPQGKPIVPKASVFGPYVDKLLIPQLTELAVDYKLDGFWVDGDCWAMAIDYSDAAQKAFTQKTGMATIPTKPGDPNWFEWTQFQREGLRNYIRHYITQVKERAPEVQICSNGAYTGQMPEPVGCGVDFISSDICGRNCVNVCRCGSRLMASQNIPWDLMSWSFCDWNLGTLDPPTSRKPAVQLMREAACVIAQGGGYQAVFTQAGAGMPPLRDGSVELTKLKPMGEVAKFCRERQEVCFKAKSIPQIAVLRATDASYRQMSQQGHLFGFVGTGPIGGIISCLLENQYAVDVMVSQKLSKQLHEYPLVVVCEWDSLEPDLRNQIADYVQQGGNVLLIGGPSIKLFGKEIGEASKKEAAQVPAPYSLTFYTVGKGTIGAVPQSVGGEYDGNPTPVVRDLVGLAVRRLFPNPLATVTGSHDVDVSVMRTPKGQLAVHLVNTSGPHRTAGVISSIEPIGPLSVTIRSAISPKSVVVEPGKRPCQCTYENGAIRLNISKIAIHDIVVVE
jgi:hypothetical protein